MLERLHNGKGKLSYTAKKIFPKVTTNNPSGAAARKKRSLELPLIASTSTLPSISTDSEDDNSDLIGENDTENEGSSEGEEEETDSEGERARKSAMILALERHQQAFFEQAIPSSSFTILKSTKAQSRKIKVDGVAQKSIRETDMNDLERGRVDNDDNKSWNAIAAKGERLQPAAVIAFQDPSRNTAYGSARDMREFMSSKIRDTRPNFSVADLVNARKQGKPKVGSSSNALNEEEENHLASLDSRLSTLIRPLTGSGGTSSIDFPSLLSSLPLPPDAKVKGSTPLPSNVPRTLRRGVLAANLKRAQARDAAAGIAIGAKRDHREALTLKEKRKEEGSDKRQRGLGGTVGKMTRNGLVISRQEIVAVTGTGDGKNGHLARNRGGSNDRNDRSGGVGKGSDRKGRRGRK